MDAIYKKDMEDLLKRQQLKYKKRTKKLINNINKVIGRK